MQLTNKEKSGRNKTLLLVRENANLRFSNRAFNPNILLQLGRFEYC